MINFEKAFEGYDVPARIKTAAESICRTFNIRGICDPMYIANTIAAESGVGDGCGNFTGDNIIRTSDIAERLRSCYCYNIPKTEIDEIIKILDSKEGMCSYAREERKVSCVC